MPQHELAFTILTNRSDDENVVLSTHRRYTDQGERWVETANGKVRQADIDKAIRPLSRRNQYGEDVTDDLASDPDFRAFVEEKRRARLADNPAATEREATITLPVAEARDFKVGRWYLLRFEEVDAGIPLRNLITESQHEAVAVERKEEKSATKSAKE
jgi:hypothetical protein